MAKENDTNSELLLEARRTTHAVRALARFVLLIVTYQVFAAIAWVAGVVALAAGGDGGATAFFVIGGLISIIGLFHSLTAGYEELSLSGREQATPASNPLAAEPQPFWMSSEQRILPEVCDCSRWVRWGNTDTKDGVTFCLHCERAISQ